MHHTNSRHVTEQDQQQLTHSLTNSALLSNGGLANGRSIRALGSRSCKVMCSMVMSLIITQGATTINSIQIEQTFIGLCDSLLLLCRLEYLERTHQSIINTHHSTSVVELPAIVRSTEDSD